MGTVRGRGGTSTGGGGAFSSGADAFRVVMSGRVADGPGAVGGFWLRAASFSDCDTTTFAWALAEDDSCAGGEVRLSSRGSTFFSSKGR